MYCVPVVLSILRHSYREGQVLVTDGVTLSDLGFINCLCSIGEGYGLPISDKQFINARLSFSHLTGNLSYYL